MRPRMSVSSARGAGWVSAKGELRGVLGGAATTGPTRACWNDARTRTRPCRGFPPRLTTRNPKKNRHLGHRTPRGWAPQKRFAFCFFSMRERISRLSLRPKQTCRVTLISLRDARWRPWRRSRSPPCGARSRAAAVSPRARLPPSDPTPEAYLVTYCHVRAQPVSVARADDVTRAPSLAPRAVS